jgi:hypothetical protein
VFRTRQFFRVNNVFIPHPLMKKSEYIAFRASSPVKEALSRIAEREGRKDVSAVLLQAVLLLLSDRGESLPPDCPEYPLRESAEGSANAQLATLIATVVPRVRARSAEWAEEYATARFHTLWQKLEELDEPRLMNDAYELFTDGKRTPREQIRAIEFRLDTFLRALDAQLQGSRRRKRNLRGSEA